MKYGQNTNLPQTWMSGNVFIYRYNTYYIHTMKERNYFQPMGRRISIIDDRVCFQRHL